MQDDWKGENLQSYGGDTVDVDAYSTVCVPEIKANEVGQ